MSRKTNKLKNRLRQAHEQSDNRKRELDLRKTMLNSYHKMLQKHAAATIHIDRLVYSTHHYAVRVVFDLDALRMFKGDCAAEIARKVTGQIMNVLSDGSGGDRV